MNRTPVNLDMHMADKDWKWVMQNALVPVVKRGSTFPRIFKNSQKNLNLFSLKALTNSPTFAESALESALESADSSTESAGSSANTPAGM